MLQIHVGGVATGEHE